MRVPAPTEATVALLKQWSLRSPTPVALTDLFKAGLLANDDEGQRIRNARFLHTELRIRVAHRCLELGRLPLGLNHRKPIQEVRNYYGQIFERLDAQPFLGTRADEDAFTEVLKSLILTPHAGVIGMVALGVREFKQSRQEVSPPDLDLIDWHLNRFFMARIGLRFLVEHHIASREPIEGYSGIIERRCCPVALVQRAADDAAYTCAYHLGEAPKVAIVGDPSMAFTYVPAHLHYVLVELLKNALRATVERHADADSLPDVKVVIARGNHDVTIKVSDEGGGIPHRDVPKCWNYLHSTAATAFGELEGDDDLAGSLTGSGSGGGISVGPLAGYGFGLPLARLYAKYFGGRLTLMSMEDYGTDAYVHLNRLGTDCEHLPSTVVASPAGGDSSFQDLPDDLPMP